VVSGTGSAGRPAGVPDDDEVAEPNGTGSHRKSSGGVSPFGGFPCRQPCPPPSGAVAPAAAGPRSSSGPTTSSARGRAEPDGTSWALLDGPYWIAGRPYWMDDSK